jgi:hypothetical protein
VDVGVAEVDLGLLERRLRLEDLGRRHLVIGAPLVDLGLRDVLVLDQLLAAPQRDLGIDPVGLGARELGLALLDDGLILVLLDHEQQLAGPDVRTLLERPLLEKPGHAGAQLDLVLGHDPTIEAEGRRDIDKLRRDHGDRGRRRRALGWLGRLSGGVKQRERKRPDKAHQPQATGSPGRFNAKLHQPASQPQLGEPRERTRSMGRAAAPRCAQHDRSAHYTAARHSTDIATSAQPLDGLISIKPAASRRMAGLSVASTVAPPPADAAVRHCEDFSRMVAAVHGDSGPSLRPA